MKKIVLRYGLASGAVLAALSAVLTPLCMNGVIHSEVVGYSAMVLSFLLVFFGVRSYRDNVAAGEIGFGKAVGVHPAGWRRARSAAHSVGGSTRRWRMA